MSGVVFKKNFEADPSLSFTFEWNKRNVYNQKVYGVVEAEVSIGYQYSSCAHTLWNSQLVRLKGFDVDVSHIGGWNLNIHHHYNPYQGNELPLIVKLLSLTNLHWGTIEQN